MSLGRDKDYSFEDKNKWRIKLWAAIKASLKHQGMKPENQIVLYLSAITDYDRKIAVRNGFRPNNLICVDSDKAVVEKLRSEGKVAIHGKLQDVLANWPESKRIGVVYADFCGGISKSVYDDFFKALFSLPVYGGCVALNLLRGRDPQFGDWRKAFKEGFGDRYPKHRGMQFFLWMKFHWFTYHEKHAPADEVDQFLSGAYALENVLKPKYMTYKSGANDMDSIVFDFRFMKRNPVKTPFQDENYKKAISRQISASMAVRTMRENGRLPQSPRV